jgi:excisionase family DNA binding protein
MRPPRRITRPPDRQPGRPAPQISSDLAASSPADLMRLPDRSERVSAGPGDTIPGRWPTVNASAVPPGVLDAVTRALAGVLAAVAATTGQQDGDGDSQLLDIDEAAELLHMSRMTVIRLVDEGQLPAIVVRRGKVQKIRRIPRAFVQSLIADASAGQHVEMTASTSAWLARHQQDPEPPDLPDGAP